MHFFFKTALLVALTALSIHLLAQERCGVVEYEKIRQRANPRLESEQQFEQWLKGKLADSKLKTFGTKKTGTPTYTIPVVVHIIHNGEAIGTGTNISDAQVISQISVLNKDYLRLNGDAIQTPADFQAVAGSIDIQFVLAKQDPEGLATTGITRTLGTKTSWTLADDATMKGLSYWPAENYLNLWVVNLNDGGYVGYAHFPVSNLPGLENSPDDRLTDGVVVHYRAFGSVDDGVFNLDASFNKGRTATHEIGHFLGLRHIWGDASCGTDYVNDTPAQTSATSGCPAPAPRPASCENPPFNPAYMQFKMFQNFLDYTNDACMNLFTQGQITRVTTVLQNSPRRTSLLTSPGATDPVVASTDLGIKMIVAPLTSACPGAITPSVKVRNYGTNTITAARLQLKQDNTVVETKDFTLNLATLDETTLTFSSLNLASGTSPVVAFEILLANGIADEKSTNNLASITAIIPPQLPLPMIESFNTLPSAWSIQNPDGLTTWSLVDVPIGGTPNKAVYMNFYDYETQGNIDRYITPLLDLSSTTTATLKFDKAYAAFTSGSNADKLRVLVATDCGADLTQAIEIMNQSGTALATTSSTGNSFKPTTQAQWKNETISLNQFAGLPYVRIIFEATNGYGNNLYLDNVAVLTSDIVDLALSSMQSPGPVICTNNPAPTVTIKNMSSFTVTSFTVAATVNGNVQTQTFTNQSLTTGQEQIFTLNPISLANGINTLHIEVSNPNDLTDQNQQNNALDFNRALNTVTESIPLRENFDGDFQNNWTIISQGTAATWQKASTNKNISLLYGAYTNTTKGEEAWLVSPVLDLSQAEKGSLHFDLSYGKNSTGNERLKVLSSGDCGNTYSQVLFDLPGDQFKSADTIVAWVPVTDDDWKRQYINLDNLAGSTNVRLAFVVTNDHGNNLYLDDLEFYVDDNPSPTQINSSFVVYPSSESTSIYKITFNLAEKMPAYVQVYNLQGQILVNDIMPETLNQTFTLDLSNQAGGLYIVRLQAGEENSATKIFIAR